MGSGLEGDLTFYVIGILMFSSSLGLQILMTIFDMIYQQAIGHGMSSSYLDNIRETAKQFFALPEEEKQKSNQ